MVKDDILTDQLLDEKAIKEQEKNDKPKAPPKNEEVKGKVKYEKVIGETPQDRFRKIVRDQGITTGTENLTSIFFEGNTDDPSWLDESLKLNHVPAKNREVIITAYYGKTVRELGITVEPMITGAAKAMADRKAAEEKKAEDGDVGLDDLAKMGSDEIKEKMKFTKNKLVLAQMNNMIKDLEKNNNPPPAAVPPVPMRQVSRPVIGKDGNILMKDGVIVYETVVEPVSSQQGSSSGSDMLSMIAALKAMGAIGDKQQVAPVNNNSVIEKMMTDFNTKFETLRSDMLIKEKDKQVEDLKHRLELEAQNYKHELEKEASNNEKMLKELEKRMTEAFQHKKELDDTIGTISGQHKKEMDEIKKQLNSAQTSIERTIVAKGTDTLAAMTEKIGDVTESIVKPMAEVYKDQFRLMIDTQRHKLGLVDGIKSTVPEVNADELNTFINQE